MNACIEGKIEAKTFYNAFERLTSMANRMDELVGLSEILVAKIERTVDQPRRDENECETPGRQPDMIDLFNGIAARWEIQIEKVGANLNKVIRMID